MVGDVLSTTLGEYGVVSIANPVRITFSEDGDQAGDPAERTKRHEGVSYPELAVKEAITNAIIHRDYSTPGAEVEIKMYPDRLVITNPGPLMPGLTTEDLKRDPHPSRRRNPALAEIAVLDHWIERAGTGTTRMIELCAAAGLPEPEFESRPSGFTVTFRRDPLGLAELRAKGVSERQLRALEHVAVHGEISRGGYVRLTGVSERTALRDLNDLHNRGILRREGSGPATRYFN